MVPAEVLVRSLVSIQQTVFLLAAADEKCQVRTRFRPTDKLRERATILCEIPVTGSFALPMRLSDSQMVISFDGSKTGIMTALGALLDAVFGGVTERLFAILPDSALRIRALREIQKLIPQPGDPWAIGFSTFGSRETILDSRSARIVDSWIEADLASEDTTMTITGALTRVFFDEKKIAVSYKPTNKVIACFLREDVVDEILEDRRNNIRTTGSFLVQVTGQFVLGPSGHPTKLTNVYRVSPVDTSPMFFDIIRFRRREFVFDPALTLDVVLDDSQQLYIASDESMGVHAYAQTRDQLAEEIAEQIAFNWDEYASHDPSELSKGAVRLRECLLARARELINGEAQE